MTKNLKIVIAITGSALALCALFVSLSPHQLRGQAGFGGMGHEDVGGSKHTPPCSVATIAGDWAVRQQNGRTADGQNLDAIGTFHLDRGGNSSAHGWYNVGGVFFGEFSRVGTTTVDADCTGTQAWNDGGPVAKIVIVRNGREIWAAYDQPGSAVVILERLDEPL